MDKKQVLIHAQLDLVMLLRYATGVQDHYNKDAAVKTLKELIEVTGDQEGIEFIDLNAGKDRAMQLLRGGA